MEDWTLSKEIDKILKASKNMFQILLNLPKRLDVESEERGTIEQNIERLSLE